MFVLLEGRVSFTVDGQTYDATSGTVLSARSGGHRGQAVLAGDPPPCCANRRRQRYGGAHPHDPAPRPSPGGKPNVGGCPDLRTRGVGERRHLAMGQEQNVQVRGGIRGGRRERRSGL